MTFAIITLSETFLGQNSYIDFSIAGFHSIIRRDRPSFGGGLAVYVREEIVYKRKSAFENMWFEVMLCLTIYPKTTNPI